MFEVMALESGPGGKRLWTAFMGMTSETLLVASAVVASMIWPQAMPGPRALMTWLAAPGPPPAPPIPLESARPAELVVRRASQVRDGELLLPRAIPARAQIIDEPPLAVAGGMGSAAGVQGGTGVENGANLLDSILRDGAPAAPAAHPVEPPPPAPAAVPRYRIGGLVKAARPLSQPQPAYPEIALRMRVSGVVELEGVIGTDGHVRELRVLRGHPLLAPAALAAVRQWLYQPTLLNGAPVEVIAPITVTFLMR
jgi:protein TonB